MLERSLVVAIALVIVGSSTTARAVDDTLYPNLKGQWTPFRVRGLGGQPSFDQTKSWGFGQNAPLTPEYKKVLEESIADQANGGQGNFPGFGCLAYGMPMMMAAFSPQEYIVTPETTYILINNLDQNRRIFTDGRDWPQQIEATFRAIQSADGSIRTATVNSIYSKSKQEVLSRDRAFTMAAVCRSTMTTCR